MNSQNAKDIDAFDVGVYSVMPYIPWCRLLVLHAVLVTDFAAKPSSIPCVSSPCIGRAVTCHVANVHDRPVLPHEASTSSQSSLDQLFHLLLFRFDSRQTRSQDNMHAGPVHHKSLQLTSEAWVHRTHSGFMIIPCLPLPLISIRFK